jgi:hypothetical protein
MEVDDHAVPAEGGGPVETPEAAVLGSEGPAGATEVAARCPAVSPSDEEVHVGTDVGGGGAEEPTLDVGALEDQEGDPERGELLGEGCDRGHRAEGGRHRHRVFGLATVHGPMLTTEDAPWRTLRVAGVLVVLGAALLPFLRWTTVPGVAPAVWSDVAFVGAVALWGAAHLFACLRGRGSPCSWRRFGPELGAVGVFALLAVGSAVRADAGGLGLVAGQVLLLAVALVVRELVASGRVIAQLVQVVGAGLLASLLLGLVGLWRFWTGEPSALLGTYGDFEPSSWFARVQAGAPHPNLLGSWCVFAAGVVAVGVGSRRHRALWFVVATGVAALTFGRSLLAVLVVIGVREIAERRWRAAVTLLGVTAAVGSWWLGSGGRVTTVSSAIQSLRAQPLLGVGPAALPAVDPSGAPFRAHLTVVDVAATLGLPALLVLAAFVLVLFRRHNRIWPGPAALLAGVFLDSLTHDVNRFRHVWVALGLAAGCSVAASARKVVVESAR